ncbi:MAG: hypothetical protein JSV49_05480 [Thermoplasmata archaeon]|nr:MAG: hypothetical protein JSV49_05480 [Thermoplasmata archaeon]
MNRLAVTIMYFVVIFTVVFLVNLEPSTGFKTLAVEKDRSCIEKDDCHDYPEFQRVMEGEALPYEHCICHSELPQSSLAVEVRGARTVTVNEHITYTVIIRGGPGNIYGYSANATAGSIPQQYHFPPQESQTFEIEYIAPDEPQSVNITFVGFSGDGDTFAQPKDNTSTGDQWNIHIITVEVVEEPPEDDTDIIIAITIIMVLIVVVLIAIILIKIRRKKRRGKESDSSSD